MEMNTIKNWQSVSIGQVLKRIERFEERQETADYQFAGTYSFGRGIFVSQRKAGSEFRLGSVQRIKAGDFVYCKIMAWEGAFGLVPLEADNCVMSGAFVAYEVDESLINSSYLGWYFKQKSVWGSIGSQSTGTNVRRRSLHPETFERATLPLPPLDEQRRIVARIEELAGKIEQARRLRREAVALADLLRRSAFSEALITNKRRLVNIGDVISFRNDLVRPQDGTKGNLRFIGLQHVESHTGRKINEDQVAAEDLDGRKFRFSHGEIVYGYLRPYLNKVWIADGEGICSVDQYVIRPDAAEVNTGYLAYYMRSSAFLSKANELTNNLMLPRLRTDLLRSIEMPLPSLPEQHLIVTRLDHLQAKSESITRLQADTAAELDALLPAVLDRAFKGELV